MKKINRFLSLLLAAVLVLGMIPAPAHAAQPDGKTQTKRVAGVNPRYADLISLEEILSRTPDAKPVTVQPQATEYLELEEAADVARKAMAAREEFFQISFISENGDYQAAVEELLELMLVHTGEPKEGDSLAWVYSHWGFPDGLSQMRKNGRYYYSGTMEVGYYTNAAQEAELDAAIEKLLADLNLEGSSDYQKIAQVYTYICDNIAYDYDNLYDSSYLLKYTAYAALMNKTAVCQGYATLFYRLMLELGIDCRVIAGDGGGAHGWNIVELDGLYYNVDSTWDAGNYNFFWFMKNFWDFGSHERYMEYDTIAFHNEYPMSALSYSKYYIEGIEPYMDPYVYYINANEDGSVFWYLNRNGTLELEGNGRTHDYRDDQMPYYGYWVDEITGVWVKEGVTGLGTNSFTDFYAVKTVRFTCDAPDIAHNAFTGITATAYYPADNATWTADKLQNYGGNLTWVAEDTAHTHSYIPTVTAPTCTEPGFTTYTCACGYSYTADYVEALGHSYIPTVTDPTCLEYGYTTFTCVCGDSYVSDYTPLLGHEMGERYTVAQPTCTENGLERAECNRCDYAEEYVLPASGHHYTIVYKGVTCTEDGYTVYTCSCGDSYTADYVEALGHSWDEGVVILEPTEEEYGEKRHTCLTCGAEKTEKIPPLGHTHSHEALITAPTCTDQGFTTYTCACGDSYVTDYTDALGHDLGDWTTVTAPTCTQPGAEERSCSRCGHTEARTTEATGHSHEATVTAPTCTDQGYTTYTCHCGDSYVSDHTAALGHDYANGICTRCGAVMENPFTDVPADQFYYEPVLWAVENGITSGTSATTFDPNGQCMRAHVVTFLWRAAGSPEPTSTNNPFVDVKESDFYYKAVLWAVEKGITNGIDATHFGPFTYCNRAQVVTFLHRAMGSPAPTAADCPFTDVAQGQWYEAPILWAVENGITNGMSATTFGVNTICNRAQVVTFLYRTYVTE